MIDKRLKLKVKTQETYNILFLIIMSFLLLTFFFQIPHLAEASFLDIGMGPRALGMGNAFTGLADDATALYYNPAGLGQLKEKEAGFSYASLYPGLDYPANNASLGDAFLGYVHPVSDKIGTFGGMWINRHASDIYAENSFIFSYARKMREGVYFGANFKILELSYARSRWSYVEPPSNWSQGNNDPVYANGNSSAGVGLDVGLLIDITEKLKVGLCIKDFNQPDIHLKDSNPVPMTVKVGANYEMGEYRILADLTTRNYDYYINAGLEWWMVEYPLAIRGGFGFGSRRYSQVSMGASYLLTPMTGPFMYQFDYAFFYPFGGLEGTIGSHRLGMTLRIR